MRTLIALATATTLVLAACGGDDDDDAAGTTAAPATTVPATTAAAPTSTGAATDTTVAAGGYVPGADPEADAAALAWTTALDSAVPFDAKAPLIEDAAELQTTIDAYAATGTQMGGITIIPTAVVVSGPAATITYDIAFAGQTAYGGQTGAVTLTDGAWIITRDQFCAFMALARTACPE